MEFFARKHILLSSQPASGCILDDLGIKRFFAKRMKLPFIMQERATTDGAGHVLHRPDIDHVIGGYDFLVCATTKVGYSALYDGGSFKGHAAAFTMLLTEFRRLGTRAKSRQTYLLIGKNIDPKTAILVDRTGGHGMRSDRDKERRRSRRNRAAGTHGESPRPALKPGGY